MLEKLREFGRGWRTVAFNIACAVLSLTQMLEATSLQSFLPAEWQIYWMLFIVVGNVFLRWVTTGPMAGYKEADDAPVAR